MRWHRPLALGALLTSIGCGSSLAPAGGGSRSEPPSPQLAELAGDHGLSHYAGGDVELWSDFAEQDVALVLEGAEAAVEALSLWLNRSSRDSPQTLLAIRSRKAERELMDQLGMHRGAADLSSVFGYYDPATAIALIRPTASLADPLAAQRIAAHEATHQFVRGEGWPIVRGAGAWFDEGIALLMERWNGAAWEFDAWDRLVQARALGSADLMLPLADFADLDRASWKALPRPRLAWRSAGRSYLRTVHPGPIQSAALMAFLVERNPDGVRHLVREGVAGRLNAKGLVRLTGSEFEQLELDWKRWLVGSGN